MSSIVTEGISSGVLHCTNCGRVGASDGSAHIEGNLRNGSVQDDRPIGTDGFSHSHKIPPYPARSTIWQVSPRHIKETKSSKDVNVFRQRQDLDSSRKNHLADIASGVTAVTARKYGLFPPMFTQSSQTTFVHTSGSVTFICVFASDSRLVQKRTRHPQHPPLGQTPHRDMRFAISHTSLR